MFYADLKDKRAAVFKRLTGVRPPTFAAMTFAAMCRVLTEQWPSGGRRPTLAVEDRLLMALMYWREYRTQLHIGQTYHVSEATVSRTVRMAEDILIRCGQFALPGRKALTRSGVPYQVVVVDATECPVERPKKNSGVTTAARRSATPKKPRSSPISTVGR